MSTFASRGFQFARKALEAAARRRLQPVAIDERAAIDEYIAKHGVKVLAGFGSPEALKRAFTPLPQRRKGKRREA